MALIIEPTKCIGSPERERIQSFQNKSKSKHSRVAERHGNPQDGFLISVNIRGSYISHLDFQDCYSC